ncbi:MAG: phosphoribosylformylglycinamidine synthase subunit PurQ, partial [Planctomycetia bacterium]
HNTSGMFVDRWVHLRTAPGRCVFLQGMDRFDLPVAHGEGRFVTRSPDDFAAVDAAGQLVLRYDVDPAGVSSNPNGAMGDVAGACDETGRILGLMPHPERFIDAIQHPAWNGRLDPAAAGAGLPIFANAVKAVS